MMRFELYFHIFSFWEVMIREMLKIVACALENDPRSISNDSRISPESFRSSFDLIFDLQDAETVNFRLKCIEQFKRYARNLAGCASMVSICAVKEDGPNTANAMES